MMLALISVAIKHRAEAEKGAPVPAEMSALLAAVLGAMGMHQKVESEATQCHAAVVRKAHKIWQFCFEPGVNFGF